MPGDAIPEQSPSAATDDVAVPDQSDLALEQEMQRSYRGDRVLSVASTFVPNMIGDLGGGSLSYIDSYGDTSGTVPLAGGDRNFKIAENSNPLPIDRVFFNYHHFRYAVSGAPGDQWYHVDRFNFGLEKTCLDGLVSFEFRIPFAAGLDSTQDFANPAATEATEFGNIPLVVKGMLLQRRCWALSAGLGIILPTGPDAVELGYFGSTQYEMTRVENEAVHLQPFLGWLWAPNQCWFAEAFAQADFDTNGHSVTTRWDPSTIQAEGILQEQSLLLLDMKVGRWIYRNRCARCITGIAPAVELHYTTTMQDADRVAYVGNSHNRVDMLNITGGIHVELGGRSDLTFFASAPLRGTRTDVTSPLGTRLEKYDIPFDAEVGLQFNYRF